MYMFNVEPPIIMRINKTICFITHTLGLIARPNVGVLEAVAIVISTNKFVSVLTIRSSDLEGYQMILLH